MAEGAHERRNPNHPMRRAGDYLADGITRTRRWSPPERAYRLAYRRRPMATLLSTVAAVLVTSVIASAATMTTVGSASSKEKKGAGAEFAWNWGDGQAGGDRTFLSTNHPAGKVPNIVVAVPKDETPMVYLQFLQDGEWNTEWITRAADGSAKLVLDPWCQNGTWCDGTYDYRIKVGGASTPVTIQYWER